MSISRTAKIYLKNAPNLNNCLISGQVQRRLQTDDGNCILGIHICFPSLLSFLIQNCENNNIQYIKMLISVLSLWPTMEAVRPSRATTGTQFMCAFYLNHTCYDFFTES